MFVVGFYCSLVVVSCLLFVDDCLPMVFGWLFLVVGCCWLLLLTVANGCWWLRSLLLLFLSLLLLHILHILGLSASDLPLVEDSRRISTRLPPCWNDSVSKGPEQHQGLLCCLTKLEVACCGNAFHYCSGPRCQCIRVTSPHISGELFQYSMATWNLV